MAAGDPTSPLAIDSGTYTPQTLLLRQRLAEAMQQAQSGQEYTPLISPWQGLARVANSVMGNYELGKLEREINANAANAGSIVAGRYGAPENAPAVAPPSGTPPAAAAPAPSADALDKNQPRSVRTNNPGAIEYGPFAKAMGATGSDGRYAIFPDMETGYKAQDTLLGHYAAQGRNTVSSIVSRWAPANVDNNSTGAYIASVSKDLGVDPNQPLTPDMIPRVSEAMAKYEAGRPVPRPGTQVADAFDIKPSDLGVTPGAKTTPWNPAVSGPSATGMAIPPAPAVATPTAPAPTPAPTPTTAPATPPAAPVAPTAAPPAELGAMDINKLTKAFIDKDRPGRYDALQLARQSALGRGDIPTVQAIDQEMLQAQQLALAQHGPITPADKTALATAQTKAKEESLELQAKQTGQGSPAAYSKERGEQEAKDVKTNQYIGGVNRVANDAKTVTQLPGFDQALAMGRASLHLGVNAGEAGHIGGDVMSPVRSLYRMADPTNPAFSAYDRIQQIKNDMQLQLGVPLTQGQRVTNATRQIIGKAIGDLDQASGAADFQFRVNDIQRMLDNMRAGREHNDDQTAYAIRPTEREIRSSIDTEHGVLDGKQVQALAQKYKIDPNDMEDYLVSLAKRKEYGGLNAGAPSAAAPAPKTLKYNPTTGALE